MICGLCRDSEIRRAVSQELYNQSHILSESNCEMLVQTIITVITR